MDELQKGTQLLVITQSADGLELRREPTMNPQTADGQDNVILFMPTSSFVVLESVEAPINDGHDWYNVRYVQDGTEETGWAVGENLQLAFFVPVTGTPDTPATNIQYNKSPKFSGQTVWLLSCPPDVLGRVNVVTFKLGTEEHATSIDSWNVALSDREKFKL